MSTATPEIYSKILKIMEGIGVIEKGQKNVNFNYMFRGIDDVYNQFQPQLLKQGVTIIPEVDWISESSDGDHCSFERTMVGKEGRTQLVTIKMRYTLTAASDGSSITISSLGEGADNQDKAVNKAMSSAYKNAIFQAFCIPVDGIDSEGEDPVDGGHHHEPRKRPAARSDGTATEKQLAMLKARSYTRAGEVGFDDDHQVAHSIRKVALKILGIGDPTQIPKTAVDGLVKAIESINVDENGHAIMPENPFE